MRTTLTQMMEALLRGMGIPDYGILSGMFRPSADLLSRAGSLKLDRHESRICGSFRTKVTQNYQSACTADIYSPTLIGEMLSLPHGSVQHDEC